MTPSLTPPAYVSKGRDVLSAIGGQQFEQNGQVAGVQALLGADAGHKYRLVGHADRDVFGFFLGQVTERHDVLEKHAGIALRISRAIVGGRTDPVGIEHDGCSFPRKGEPPHPAVQGRNDRLTASQRSLLLALGEPDRHGLRHTHRAPRVRQFGWLQSAQALFRRGFIEKHREDGTHAIGDGAGRVWLTLTAAGEALLDKIKEDQD